MDDTITKMTIGTPAYKIDYDGGPEELVRNAFNFARDHQQQRYKRWKEEYKLYNGIKDRINADPRRASVFIKKIKSIIKSKAPKESKAMLGSRPYLPFTAKQREMRPIMAPWNDYVDDLLDMGNYFVHADLATLLKLPYGVSFMDHEVWMEPVPVKKPARPELGGIVDITQYFKRLRIKFNTYAPWEVFFHPKTTNLEEKGGCPYAIKLVPARWRDVKRMIENGSYPQADLDQLQDKNAMEALFQSTAVGDGSSWGDEILAEHGIDKPRDDGDFGLIFRYESEERYIDSWNGILTLRDTTSNPHTHGLIHLSRFPHEFDAHTANAFWAQGEVKDLQVYNVLLNDFFNRVIDASNQLLQPVVYHDQTAIPAERIVYQMANRISVDRKGENRPITDFFHESPGREVPRTHYEMMEIVRGEMDDISHNYQPNRGEPIDRRPLATELLQTERIGDEAQEVTIRRGEEIFQKDFQFKLLHSVSEFANFHDLKESVGTQAAVMAMMYRPTEVPGGIKTKFKGSSRVSKQRVRQAMFGEHIAPKIFGNEYYRQDLALKLLFEVFDEDKPEVLEGIIPYEDVMQNRLLMLLGQGMAGGRKSTAGGETETDMKLAQREGRQMRSVG